MEMQHWVSAFGSTGSYGFYWSYAVEMNGVLQGKFLKFARNQALLQVTFDGLHNNTANLLLYLGLAGTISSQIRHEIGGYYRYKGVEMKLNNLGGRD
jgi:hypothetical protein